MDWHPVTGGGNTFLLVTIFMAPWGTFACTCVSIQDLIISTHIQVQHLHIPWTPQSSRSVTGSNWQGGRRFSLFKLGTFSFSSTDRL